MHQLGRELRKVRTPVTDTALPLLNVLRSLKATGWDGFEGLVVSMLKGVVNHEFRLANAGLQGGQDAHSSLKEPFLLAVECKRYRDRTPLSQRDLLSEVEAAYSVSPLLDCWILAVTREITAQEERYLSQACESRGIAYVTLDCARLPNVGLLDALCAFQSDRALEHLRSRGSLSQSETDAFARAAEAIRTQRGAEAAYERLQQNFSAQTVGFSQFRAKLNSRVIADLTSPEKCVLRFRCAMGPRSTRTASGFIERHRLLSLLDHHWQVAKGARGASLVAVHGEEGAGKSWAVATWVQGLLQDDEPPVVFFITAGEPTSNSASRVLAGHAAEYGEMSNEELTRRRLQRWLAIGPSQQGRRAVVIIDGLNERLEASFWGPLIDDLRVQYANSVHVVVTCRTQTWHETIVHELYLPATELEVGAFDDTEFAEAISTLAADQKDRMLKLGQLVRRPRYFHLACEYVEELVAFGELTVPMLYYYDWKHRHSRRPYQPISQTSFEQVLMALAQRQRDTTASFERGVALEVLGLADYRQGLEDLASSRIIMPRRTGRLALQPSFLALGLGMYLASHLDDEGGNLASRVELAQVLLGETSSWDFTSEVLQQALLHSMISSPPCSLETQVAILVVWGTCLNAADASASAVPKIVAANPELVLRYAEFAWSAASSSHLMETAVLHALVRLLRDPAGRRASVGRLTEWVSLIHEMAEHQSCDPDSNATHAPDVLRLCRESAHVFEKSAVILRHTENRQSLRLGRLALAAVSTANLCDCWPVIKTAFASDEAMGNPRGSLLTWIVRSATVPIDELVDQTVSHYLADNDPVAFRAAHRLLIACGAPSLMKRVDDIPRDQWPTKSLWRVEFEADPCASFFVAPRRQQLARCLEREDVPYHINAARARELAADCSLQIPESFQRQVRRQAELLNVSRLRLEMCNDEQDHAWSGILPLLARVAPACLEELVRRFAATARDRSGLPLRQLSWTLEEFSELLGKSEVEILEETWRRHHSSMDVSSSDDLFVESMIASILLPNQKKAADQLAFLLGRSDEAYELLAMSASFARIEPSDQASLFRGLIDDSDDKALRVALWMLNSQPELDEVLATELIAAAASSNDSGTRGQALQLAERIENHHWATLPAFQNWSVAPSMWSVEEFYGTMMVMRCSLEADALERCSNRHMGEALASLDDNQAARWAALYADRVLDTCQRLISTAPSCSHPPVEVDVGRQEYPWRRISLSPKKSKGETFFQPLTSWGGLAPGDIADVFGHMENVDDGEARRAAWHATFDAETARGNWLFAAYIPSKTIDLVHRMCPTFIEQLEDLLALAEATGRIARIQAVVEALVRFAFETSLPQALRWYQLIEKWCNTIRYVDVRTGLSSHQAALLNADPSTEIAAEWRRLLSVQPTDLDLYLILNGLMLGGNQTWVRDDAEAQIKSGSPRGRAMGLVMLSALEDNGEHLRNVLAELAPSESSWYSELGDLCCHYGERRRDQLHWLTVSMTGDSARERVAAAVLAAHIEDSRTAGLIQHVTSNTVLSGDLRRKAIAVRQASRQSVRSGWSKHLSERLFGSRIQRHAAHPWLPI